MESFGDKLKNLRSDLTLDKASKGIGIKPSTLSSYENGYRMPGLKTIIKLAKYYDTSIDYLLGVNTKDNTKVILNELEDIATQINKLKELIKRGC